MTTQRRRRSFSWPSIGRSATFYAIASAGAIIFVFPLVWCAVTSLKPPDEASAIPPTWLPSALSLGNYEKLASYGLGIWQYFGNSLAVAAMTVVITGVVSTLAGYGFARHRFPAHDAVFLLILTVIMIPFQTMIVPLFSVVRWLGLYNTLPGLALVYTTFQLPFGIFVMRNAFEAVPRELDDAGLVDGCSSFGVLVRILLPIVRPAIVTVMLFAFLASWNEFFAALILLSDGDKFTLPIMLMNAQTGSFGTIDWGAQEAAVTVMMLPVIVVFLGLQRYYVTGLITGGVKG